MKLQEFIRHHVNHIQFLKERQRTRSQLLKLDAAALEDIGISRELAIAEGTKPFWLPRKNNQPINVSHAYGAFES